jgi:hypothetical protein
MASPGHQAGLVNATALGAVQVGSFLCPVPGRTTGPRHDAPEPARWPSLPAPCTLARGMVRPSDDARVPTPPRWLLQCPRDS